MYKLDHFLKLLKENKPFAYVSIADGEMGAISEGEGYTTSKKYQIITKELQGEIKKALLHRQENYYVGICCDQWKVAKKEKEMVGDYKNLTYAWIFQMVNWHKTIRELTNLLGNRRVVWIGGQDQDVTKLPFNVEMSIGVPAKEAWSINDRMAVRYFEPGDIVLVSAGCNAVAWIYNWFQEFKDTTFIDIGSTFDPFTRNVWRRYQIDPNHYCSGCKNKQCK